VIDFVLNIHQSNRLEALAEQLAVMTRAKPLASPFSPEVIIVQSRGVARWLALQLASHNGVCANVRFPFPIGFAWEVYQTLGDLPQASPFESGVMAWRIMQLLPRLEPLTEFAPVQSYIDGDPLRRYDLARRLAEMFEQYLVYRPDWITQWEAGKEEHWQARLWQQLAKASGAPHRVMLHRRFLQRVCFDMLAAGGIPERISVFGAPALPPVLLDLFAALASHIEVHVFVSNPCLEYWGDIAAAREVARSKLTQRPDAAFLDTGNPLLASLGKQGRDFIDLVQNYPAHEHEKFIDPGEASLLCAIQSDILRLRERGATVDVLEVAADDRSVQVHSCHSAMREVEVLHDQLLALFERHPGLQPSDIVVMTPDIESYAPYIEAVFATAEPRIAFSISDRSSEHESTLTAAFMALLELPGSRYDANRVLAILDEPAAQQRFGLWEDDLDTVHRWVRDAQIRWGIDAAHRASLALPATAEHTWRFGLDRLLLGYALPGGNERLFGDILPYDEVEGGLGQVLGRFLSFAEAAMELNTLLAPSRTMAQWAQVLRTTLARFFDPDDAREAELEALSTAINTLEADAFAGGFSAAVPLAVVRTALREHLEIAGRAFLSGGVTFCAMIPMRSLPFEVVCLIGMNDGAFPRMRRPHGFDLMAADFRKGDRSRRDDDRYLFLESLLSARRCFYLSYTGQHIRDNSVIPPSVLVSELLDYVAQGFHAAGGADIRDQLITQHPLQAFSRRYFDGSSKLFSYSDALREAANRAGRGGAASQPLIPDDLPEPEAEWRTVELESLIRFLRNPVRYLLQQRLKIRLEEAEEEVAAREPFTADPLQSYELKQRLLALRLRAEPVQDALAVARASGLLPHARVGEALFERASDAVDGFAAKVLEAQPKEMLDPIGVDLALGEMRMRGTLSGVSKAGLLGYRLARFRAKDLLNAWVRHLVLNVVAPEPVARVTRWIGQDDVVTFAPVDDARAILMRLLELYWTGLRRPLHFFPDSAQAYVEKNRSLDAAHSKWDISDFGRGEAADSYYRLAFRGFDPLDTEFEEVAMAVFGPIQAAMQRESAA
jgi:exodeoxyribonuclease V gamma subunit